MKKSISLFLALLIALSGTLAGCSEGTESSDTQPGSEGAAAETEITAEEGVLTKDDLPEDLDFNGETITIHIRNGDNGNPQGNCVMEMTVEELTGDLLNDAIFNRNLAVNERLNVVINPYVSYDWTGYGNSLAEIRASVNANEDTYDIIAGWGSGNITSLALEGCFLPLDGVPYIDTEKPWWNQALINTTPLGGQTFFITGEANMLTSLGSAISVFVNEQIETDYQIPSLTKYVDEGTWTIDKMSEVTEMVQDDLNGNGRMDTKTDRFGIVLSAYHAADAFYTSFDIHQIEVDDTGYMTYIPNEERIHTALEKVYDLHYNNPGAIGWISNTREIFLESRALMTLEFMEAAREEFREMADSYYIIPTPKYDEIQDQYYTYFYNNMTLLSVPVTNQQTDAAFATMEALSSESYFNVTPVFFEDCMQNKYARSDTTSRMLEIIRETCYVDYEYIYGVLFSTRPNFVFRDLIGAKSSDSASWIARNSSSIQKQIDKAMIKLSQ